MAGRNHFLISPDAIIHNRFKLNGSEAHHLLRVTRMKKGEMIYLLDFRGSAYLSKIEKIQNNCVEGTVLKTIPDYGRSKVNIHLGIGILKGSKMDMIVEKGTELGVYSITPLIMRHNVKQNINIERLHRISESTIKQCGRGLLPEINSPAGFRFWCESADIKHVAIADYRAESIPVYQWLTGLNHDITDLWLAVGPEGGFSNDELEYARNCHIPFVSLGPRRLRSETAVFAILAVCDIYFEGNLKYA